MTPELRSRIYFHMASLGGVAAIGLAAATIFAWPDFVIGLFTGMTLVSLAVILWRGLRDEYTQSLWQSGTSFAFVVIVILSFFGPVLFDFGRGILFGCDDIRNAALPHFDGDTIGVAALIAFYAAFHLAWLRSMR